MCRRRSLPTSLVCLVIAGPTSAGDCQDLFPLPEIHLGLCVRSVTSADLDGDGIQDLAFRTCDAVNIRRGRGDGTFEEPEMYLVGSSPGSPAIGDMDGDGDLDLVVGENDERVIAVLFNDGNGVFADPVTYAAGTSIALGDLEGDGDLDVVTIRPSSEALLPYLNDGTGILEPGSVQHVRGGGPDLGDFDGDGDLDATVVSLNDDEMQVLLYEGDGVFAEGVTYETGREPNSPVVGDLDGDGYPDIAAANQVSRDVSVFLNNGDGTFGAHARYGVAGLFPMGAVLHDLEGDGDLDMFVPNRGSYGGNAGGGGAVSVFVNRGDGTFEPQVELPGSGGANSVAIADFNSNGLDDLAVGGRTAVAILLATEQGVFPGQILSPVAQGSFLASAIADLDGDRTPDAAVASSFGLVILRGEGNGLFEEVNLVPSTILGRFLTPVDIDGDGDLDLAAGEAFGSPDTVHTYENLGGMAFAEPVEYAVREGPAMLAAGDLDGDAAFELVVANATDRSISVLPNLGDSFGEQVVYEVEGGARSVAIGDLNGDREPDVVVIGADNFSVLLNDGDGDLELHAAVPVGSRFSAVALADLNEDGFVDLAIAGEEDDTGVWTLFGNGDGTFGEPSMYPAFDANGIVASDLDGDSDTDLAVANGSGDNVIVLLNDGDGFFADSRLHGAGNFVSGITAVDLDRDGDIDLATQDLNSATISSLLNICRECPADVTGSGTVGMDDVLVLLTAWGPCGDECSGDVDPNGVIDSGDLDIVLRSWDCRTKE